MTYTPIKVGVIGSGIGRAHLSGYRAQGYAVDIVALCDLNKDRLNAVADEFKIPLRYTDINQLLASGELQAVSVCLPNHLHAPVAIAALEAGLHVLCEKPLAENMVSARKVVEAKEKASSKFMMCFNRRYRHDVQWMKQFIDSGQLGKIYQVKAGWIRETGIPVGGWFSDKAMSGGGPLIDLGVHVLDSVMWLLDYPAPITVSGNVQANFGPRHMKQWGQDDPSKSFDVEDSATAFIRLDNGTIFNLETSWASHIKPGTDDIFITLMGTEGTIELYIANYASEKTLTVYSEINGVPVTTRPAVKENDGHDHQYVIAEFIQCIQNDTPPTAPAEHGYVIMEIIDAIYQSAATGREISLA
jgi:predicted dehydrogenase